MNTSFASFSEVVLVWSREEFWKCLSKTAAQVAKDRKVALVHLLNGLLLNAKDSIHLKELKLNLPSYFMLRGLTALEIKTKFKIMLPLPIL